MQAAWSLTERRALPDVDLVHYYNVLTGEQLCSRGRHFWMENRAGRRQWQAAFPSGWPDIAASSRLARRLGRLDQCTLAAVGDGWFGCRAGQGYYFAADSTGPHPVLRLRQCRNPLQIAVASDGGLMFGEYGSNAGHESIPLWACGPTGRDWRIVYEIPAGRARHVHGVFRDPYDDAVFVTTGDFAGENWLIRCDPRFEHVEYWGDGSQQWRAVALFFTPDCIVWITDSHLERNHVTVCDRRSRRIERLAAVPSPCWYGKTLSDGIFLAGCAWEHGAGCEATGATLLASRDGVEWASVATWKKDPWPAPWFKNGVVRFAEGPQTAADFVLAGEGLVGLDGVAKHFALSATPA